MIYYINDILSFIYLCNILKQRRLLIKEGVSMRYIGYGTDMIFQRFAFILFYSINILLHIILPVYMYNIMLKRPNYALKTIDALIRLSATVRA